MTSLRRLGAAGPMVPAIGLGCMGMSGSYGPADEHESIATIRRALDLGVSHLDTSASYGRGHNETLVGRAIAGRRDEVVLATKFGILRNEHEVRIDSSPARARASCEESLRRLGTDVIDLFYVHRRHPSMPIEATMEELARLVAEGKVRHVGLSEVAADTIRRAHAVHPVAALQMEYSIFSRDIEESVLPTCRELGIGVVAYSPVGGGLLTGRYAAPADVPEFMHGQPRMAEANLDPNLELVARLRTIAAEIGCTPAQLALAWLLAQGDDILAIPGTKRASYLEENIAAAGLHLGSEVLARIDRAVPRDAVAGDRLRPDQVPHVGH
ncbi:MAG TPA: aldo/keto reductase [Candidatus Limnocylindrales bacterium]